MAMPVSDQAAVARASSVHENWILRMRCPAVAEWGVRRKNRKLEIFAGTAAIDIGEQPPFAIHIEKHRVCGSDILHDNLFQFPSQREFKTSIDPNVADLLSLRAHKKLAFVLENKWKGQMKGLLQGHSHPAGSAVCYDVDGDSSALRSIIEILYEAEVLAVPCNDKGIGEKMKRRIFPT